MAGSGDGVAPPRSVPPSPRSWARAAYRSSSAARRRKASIARRRPTRHQPPSGVGGHAVTRPGDQRLGEGLLGEVFGEREVAGGAGERADDAGRLDPPHGTDGLAPRPVAHSWPVASRQARSFWIHSLSCGNSSMLATRRISVFMPGPAIGARLAHSTASSLRRDVEDPVAAEQLLGLTVRAVGHDRRLRRVVDDDALGSVVEALGRDQHAGRDHLVVETAHRLEHLFEVERSSNAAYASSVARMISMYFTVLSCAVAGPRSDPLTRRSNGRVRPDRHSGTNSSRRSACGRGPRCTRSRHEEEALMRSMVAVAPSLSSSASPSARPSSSPWIARTTARS